MKDFRKSSLELFYPWLPTKDSKKAKCFFCQGKNPVKERFCFKLNNKIFTIKHCFKDDILFLSPQPGGKYAESLYNHPSYYRSKDDMYGLSLNERKSAAIAKIRIAEIFKYKPDARSILEIGCGFGNTLLEAKKEGFKVINGLEFSKKALLVCKQKGLKVYKTSIKSLPVDLIGKKYDVVAMYSVLEHMPNPLGFLKNIKPLLAKDGILVIRIPEMSARGPWLSLLDHFWHFTRKSLNKIIEEVG
ncbi:MAG: class I SAM-dependent methyltransferase, partial [bacterium]|nr:class I SAM-dependent methyltransferase [bacterium]